MSVLNEPAESTLACMVFMPFSPSFSIVYDFGIAPAIDDMRQMQPTLSVTLEKADTDLVIDADKVKKIVDSLKRSDLVIADISGLNPNVLWELGFSHALEKPTIILSQPNADLPFNLKTRDVLKYELSTPGLKNLRKGLLKALLPIVQRRLERGASLRADSNIAQHLEGITHGIDRLERDSILTTLVKNELERLERRIRHLQEGKFDLRNAKPNSEITEYFCNYVDQLHSNNATYDTISIRAFWLAITDNGEDLRYLTANGRAGRLGAKIRRVFLLDHKEYPDCNVKADSLLGPVLARHLAVTLSSEGRILTKVFFSDNYTTDVRTYQNFAVWRQGHESMLFIPQYDSRNGRMLETLFTHISDRRKDMPKFADNEKEIRAHDGLFLEMWERGVTLEPKHFE